MLSRVCPQSQSQTRSLQTTEKLKSFLYLSLCVYSVGKSLSPRLKILMVAKNSCGSAEPVPAHAQRWGSMRVSGGNGEHASTRLGWAQSLWSWQPPCRKKGLWCRYLRRCSLLEIKLQDVKWARGKGRGTGRVTGIICAQVKLWTKCPGFVFDWHLDQRNSWPDLFQPARAGPGAACLT